jgi:hypothetical protein
LRTILQVKGGSGAIPSEELQTSMIQQRSDDLAAAWSAADMEPEIYRVRRDSPAALARGAPWQAWAAFGLAAVGSAAAIFRLI